MTTQKQTNVSMLQTAAASFLSADKSQEAGMAQAIVGMADAASAGGLLTAKYKDKEGKERSHVFSLFDYAFPVRKPDGSVNGKLRSAMKTAIMMQLFGQPEKYSDKVRAGFDRAFGPAMFVSEYNANNPKAPIGIKGGALTGVPVGIAFELADKDGAPTKLHGELVKRIKDNAAFEGREISDDEAAERLTKRTVICDGSKNSIYGKMPRVSDVASRLKALAVEEGLIPAPDKHAARTTSGGVDFDQACAFLTGGLRLTEDGEAELALSEERLAKAKQLYTTLSAYIAASEEV